VIKYLGNEFKMKGIKSIDAQIIRIIQNPNPPQIAAIKNKSFSSKFIKLLIQNVPPMIEIVKVITTSNRRVFL
jgi:hypothetical protein